MRSSHYRIIREIRHYCRIGVAILTTLTLIVVNGCGNTEDPNYQPPTGVGYHPFADPAVDSHGEFMAHSNYNFSLCTECHGTAFHGVDNGVIVGGEKDRSCY